MKRTLLNFLKIRENEAYKVFQFFLFALVIQAGVAIGESISNSMFLVHVGFEELPYIYILTAVVMLFVYIPIYTYFTNKYTEDKFFFYFMIFLMIVNLGILFFIQFAKAYVPAEMYNYIFYFLLLYTTIVVITVYTLLWNFIDTFFDIIDSKRVFSIFSAGTAIGAIVGGGIVTLASQYLSAEVILNIWSFFVVLGLFVFMNIRKKFEILIENEEDTEDENIITLLGTMFKNLKSSTYVMVLSLVFMLSIIIATLLEFEYMNILSKDQSVESLALLFGQLFMAVNVFNLIVNFFVFNRLVISFGVKNVILIQPIVFIFTFLYLSVEMGIDAGILGFFVVQGVLVSIEYNNQNFLYNGISKKNKYQVRTFIESLGEPITISIAGFLLLLIGSKMSISEIAFLALILSFIYLIFGLILKNQYPKAMAENLKEEWFDLGKDENLLLESIPLNERKEALNYLNNSKNYSLVAKFVSTYSYSDAVSILLTYMNSIDSDEFKKNKKFLFDLLDSQHPDVTKEVIDWIDKQEGILSITLEKELGARKFLSYENAYSKLEDDNKSIVSASAAIILDSHYPEHTYKAISIVEKLLHSGKEDDIVEVLYILSKSKHVGYAFFAAEFLDSKDKNIRLCALETIFELCDNTSSKLVKPVLNCFIIGTKEERSLSLDILYKIKDTQSLNSFFLNLNNLTSYEKRQVSKIVKEIGLKAVPTVINILMDDTYPYISRSIAARALGKLAFEQLKVNEDKLILQELENVYKYLYMHTIILDEFKKTNDEYLFLLSEYLIDKHELILEFILENLSICGEMESFELIKTSLRSSNSKVRGNAIETIEQSTKNFIFAKILPLLDDRSIDEIMNFYKKNFKKKEYTLNDVLLESFFSNTKLEVVISVPLLTKYNKNYLEIFRERLLDVKTTKLVKNTILFELLDEKDYVNVVSKLVYLVRDNFMNNLSIFSLYLMLANSYVKDYDEKVIIKDNVLVYVLEGKVELFGKEYTNGIVGKDTVFVKNQGLEVKCLKKSKLLIIQKSSITDAIEISPEIGLAFFKV